MKIEKRSNEWLTEQLVTIGSSAAGVVAGESPYGTPLKLYTAMVDAAEGRLSEHPMNDDMRRGILTEPLHRQILAEQLGRKVHDHDQDMFIYNEKYSWAHALPDGWVYEDGGIEIPVQLKCPRVRSWHELRLKGIHGHWLLGSQHTLAITGAPYEHFSVLNPESMQVLPFVIFRDEPLIEKLMDMERKFYAMFMERTPPEDTQPPRLELPPLTGELVEINSKESELASANYFEAKARLDDASELYGEALTALKKLMGDARVADMPGLRAYKSNQKGRLTHDHKAMRTDGIDVDKYAKRGDDFERFQVFKRG
jgi:putative phage-type endonuclease